MAKRQVVLEKEAETKGKKPQTEIAIKENNGRPLYKGPLNKKRK